MKLIVLSGPSGVGKDTVLDAWIQQNPKIERVITCTTRRPREGEVHGVHYFFHSEESFLQLAEEHMLIEHKRVHSNWYGSPKSEAERITELGKIPVLKIDVQGGIEVINNEPEAISIFLLPPSLDELKRRLGQRGSETEHEFQERIANAVDEMKAGLAYTHQVVNDQIEDTVAQLEAILA